MRITVSSSTFLQGIRQKVFINGSLNSAIYCTDISLSQGGGGSTANFQCPTIEWDSKGWLGGAVVRVEACLDSQSFVPCFYGYCTNPQGDARSRVANFSAESPMVSMFDLVYIGDGCTPITQYAHYPTYAFRNGILRPTKWLASEILRDFTTSRAKKSWRGGGGTLPSQHISVLKFGDLSMLNKEVGEVTFDGITLKSALQEIVAKVGNVGYREVADYNGVKIEFYQLTGGAASKNVKNIRVATQGESCGNSNVAEISSEFSNVDVKTRIIAMGARIQYVLSAIWHPWLEAEETANHLIPAWNRNLETYALQDPEQVKEPYQHEAQAVAIKDSDLLINRETEPEEEEESESASASAPAQTMAVVEEEEQEAILKNVFTRFKLPNLILENIQYITNEIPIEIAGEQCKPVAIKWTVPLVWSDAQKGYIADIEAPLTPVAIGDYTLDVNSGFITIGEPAICIYSQVVNADAETVTTYIPCPISITLCFAGERLMHDTGQVYSDARWYPLGRHGLVSRIDNESFQKVMLGDNAFPQTYLYNGNSVIVTPAPSVYRDDSKTLKQLAEKVLDESNDERRTYSITLPYFDSSFRIGDLISLQGVSDYDFGAHTICTINHNLTQQHSTTISTDNSAPLINSNLFDSWGE